MTTLTRYTNETSGVTTIQAYARDGFLLENSGSAVHGVRYEPAVESGLVTRKAIPLDAQGSDTGEWVKTWTDFLGRDFKTEYPDGGYQQSFFNARGQVYKSTDPDGVTTLYAYNGRAEFEYTALSAARGDSIDVANDRLRRRSRPSSPTMPAGWCTRRAPTRGRPPAPACQTS